MTQLLATLDDWIRRESLRAADSFAPGRAVRARGLVVLLLALLTAGGGVALAVQAVAGLAPRAIVLEARDMAFYLPGDPTPNPRLVVAAGEPLRLVLRNREPGMAHDVAVPDGEDGWRRSREVRAAGETAALTFTAPETPGTYAYVCTFHSRMMRGVLEVR